METQVPKESEQTETEDLTEAIKELGRSEAPLESAEDRFVKTDSCEEKEKEKVVKAGRQEVAVSPVAAEHITGKQDVSAPEKQPGARWKRLFLIFGLVLVILGCAAGGFFIYRYIKDASKREAARITVSGDQMLDYSKTEAENIRDQINAALNALLSGAIKSSDEFKSYSESIQKKIDELLQDLDRGKEIYGQVLRLKDLKHYKSYARARINQIEWSSKTIQTAKKLMVRITEILAAAEAKVRLNRKLIEDEIAGFIAQMAASSKKAQAFKKEAEKIKKTKKI